MKDNRIKLYRTLQSNPLLWLIKVQQQCEMCLCFIYRQRHGNQQDEDINIWGGGGDSSGCKHYNNNQSTGANTQAHTTFPLRFFSFDADDAKPYLHG